MNVIIMCRPKGSSRIVIIFKRVHRVHWGRGRGSRAAVRFFKMLIMMHCTFIPGSPKSTFSKYLLFSEGGDGVTKKSTLCTLLIMLIIMDDPKYWRLTYPGSV